MNLIETRNLTLFRGGKAVIHSLDLTLCAQQRLFLQGEIGAGKSTLLLALLGFMPLAQGEIRLFGQTCTKEKHFAPFRGKIGLCFQNAEDQLFGPTVLDDVAFGARNQGYSKAEAYAIAQAQLERLGIQGLKDRPVNALSGGEKNFTALAGVLAMRPEVLLLDEPTNGLDSKNRAKLSALLAEIALPMIIASHDHAFCETLATHCLSLPKRTD